MPNNKLETILLQPDCQSTEQLIREWLVKLAELHRKNGAPYPLTAVMTAVWIDSLLDLDAGVLDSAFRKLAQVGCRREFPVPADVRTHIDRTRETAVTAAAEMEWHQVLDLRRRYWSPDMPGGFSSGMPKLSERVDRAARASGIFKLQDCEPEQIHVWAKKRFVETYVAWAELEQDQFLLPDGELKQLLAGVAETKALPYAPVEWSELHSRGLEYAKSPNVRAECTSTVSVRPILETSHVMDAAELERQKRLILQKHPNLGNMKGIPPELRPVEVSV